MEPKHAFPVGAKWHIFSRPGHLTPEQREREFLIGAPLVMIPAVFSIPVWLLLVHVPRFRFSTAVANMIYVGFAVSLTIGVHKLIRCMRVRQIDLTSAMAFGVLLVLCVMLVYACVFFFAMSRGLAPL